MSRNKSCCRPVMNRRRGWHNHIVAWLALLVFLSGCSGITPEQLRNNREEGPEKGLFSGPGGEFVLIAPSAGKPKVEDADEAAEVP